MFFEVEVAERFCAAAEKKFKAEKLRDGRRAFIGHFVLRKIDLDAR